MSYKALLFCPDEKTARVVTQVLSELDFQVEPCNEPFAAVKKLTAEHFDAIVVECDNEQNASLLFKSAKGSGLNQQSLSVAVVEGQSGVAKAFRLGANLVLTKPINVEQAKGTLRVARGLLRKNEGAKASVTPSPSVPAPVPAHPVTAAPFSASAPGVPPTHEPSAPRVPVFPPPQVSAIPAPAASMFEVENDPEVKPDSTEVAFLESMPDPLAGTKRPAESATIEASKKGSPWQQSTEKSSTPAWAGQTAPAAAKLEAHESTDHASTAKSAEPPRAFPAAGGFGQGAAAAPAPAKEPVPSVADEPTPTEVEPPTFSSLGSKPAKHESEGGGGSKKLLVVAAIVLVAAAAGYFGWNKMHSTEQVSTPPSPAPSAPASTLGSSLQVPSSVTPAPASSPITADPKASPQPPAPSTITAPESITASEVPSKSAPDIYIGSSAPKSIATAKPAAETLVVKSESSKPAAPIPAPAENVQPPSASALSPTSDSSDRALSGIMSAPTATVTQSPSSLKVSQGVAQGLQIKRVQPVYPQQARQARLQGAVELLATIGKDGNITGLKQVKGDTVLGKAAMDAVKQWKYRPYLLDGQPFEIQTQITVNFTLP